VAIDLPRLLAEVTRIAPRLHKAGTFSAVALEAFVRHASARPLRATAETGSGASTLLLSHLSDHHTVFAMDGGTGSVRAVASSPLLRPGIVTFVEGPTQLTLPAYEFRQRLQLALIDGPHAYPFPDLEYYYFYPRLETDALLVLDDIHIPTITNLFDVLRADEMFAVEEVVETTAFFRRTAAPTFPPTEDGWWRQGYNKRAFDTGPPELVTHDDSASSEGGEPFFVDRFGSATEPPDFDRLRLSALEPIVVSGWALDPPRRQSASAVDFIINGRTYRATPRLPRGDVADAFGSHDYFRSGFTATFPAGAFAPGVYDVQVRILIDGGRCHVPGMHFRFEIV
jgi:hypothetical protein